MEKCQYLRSNEMRKANRGEQKEMLKRGEIRKGNHRSQRKKDFQEVEYVQQCPVL